MRRVSPRSLVPFGVWLRAAAVLAVLGATVGPVLDGIHTHTGTTWYPHPQLWLSVWWCPPLFSFAAVSIGLSRPLAQALLGRVEAAPPRSGVGLGMALLGVGFALSGVLPFGWAGKTAVLIALGAAAWGACDRTELALLLAALNAAGGSVVEMVLVSRGDFFHRDAEFAGVPLWLPWLYALASIGMGCLGRRLVFAPARESVAGEAGSVQPLRR